MDMNSSEFLGHLTISFSGMWDVFQNIKCGMGYQGSPFRGHINANFFYLLMLQLFTEQNLWYIIFSSSASNFYFSGNKLQNCLECENLMR